MGSDGNCPLCGRVVFVVYTLANEGTDVPGGESTPIGGPSSQRYSATISSGRGRHIDSKTDGRHLYAFRLVAGTRHWPGAVGAAGTSGYASHYAGRRVGRRDAFPGTRRPLRGA